VITQRLKGRGPDMRLVFAEAAARRCGGLRAFYGKPGTDLVFAPS
jgi:hypothetical protein